MQRTPFYVVYDLISQRHADYLCEEYRDWDAFLTDYYAIVEAHGWDRDTFYELECIHDALVATRPVHDRDWQLLVKLVLS